ncbi:hypothetical protein F4803DRAFT_436778 [Xylaria telfairii]|nr:hypothetical protein F4803DRAFT_436778 [Xylaria telfairii]
MPSQSFSYSFVSTSTSTNGGAPQSTAYAERSVTDDNGTKTERMRQLPGQAPVYETSERSRVSGGATSQQNRITDASDAKEKEKAYEEKMEDEYAKREGGA